MNGAAVDAPKPRSRRTIFAGLLLLVMVAAFATAFYVYGGTGIVADLVKSAPIEGLFGPLTGGTSKPSTVPTSSATASTPASLPAGMDEEFANRVYYEQIESQNNVLMLVNDKVKRFTFGGVSKSGSDAVLQLRVTFADGTAAPGVAGMTKQNGYWYFTYIAGRAPKNTPGMAGAIGKGTDETSAVHFEPETPVTVDPGVVSTMIEQERASQECLAELSEGAYSAMTVDRVDAGQGTATLHVTLMSKKEAPTKAQLICITKAIDGRDTWFVTTFKKV